MRHYQLKSPWPAEPAGERQAARPAAARHVARDYQADGGWKPLTRRQKWRLCELALRAARAMGEPVSGLAHAEWRRDEARRSAGCRISEGCQRDYSALKAHFLNLAGEPDAAFGELMQADGNTRRVALWNLTKALGERGLPAAYAEAICRRQYKCGLAQASAPQLWRLLYTVKNRREKRST